MSGPFLLLYGQQFVLTSRRFPVGRFVLASVVAGCGTMGGSSPRLVHVAELERAGTPPQAAVAPAVPPAAPGTRPDTARHKSPFAAVADSVFTTISLQDETPKRPHGEAPSPLARPAARTASTLERVPEGTARGRRARAVRQGQWIRVEGTQRLVSFTFVGKDLAEVLALFAEQSGRDIITAREVDDVAITASIRGQEWHLALEAILVAYDLRPVESGSGIIIVVPKDRAQQSREPHPVELKHRLAREVEPALRRVLGMDADTVPSGDGVEIIGDPKTSRTLVLHTSPDRLAQARSLVTVLDKKPRSVTIEWRQVEVNRNRMQQLGLGYQLGQFRDSTGTVQPGVMVRPAGGLRATGGRAFELLRRSRGGVGALSLNGFVDALAEDGFGETETAQTITVNSDESAEIRVGDAFILPNNQPILASGGYMPAPFGQPPGGAPVQGAPPYGGTTPNQPGLVMGGYQAFETGTSVKATAYVLSEEEVRLDLELIRDGGTLSPDGRAITGGKQSAMTRVTVKNGTPVVIGGLSVNGRNRTNSGLPGVSRLPVVGRVFRNEGWAEQHRDLLIIVTPRINVEDDEP